LRNRDFPRTGQGKAAIENERGERIDQTAKETVIAVVTASAEADLEEMMARRFWKDFLAFNAKPRHENTIRHNDKSRCTST
jgi:hypothetical protein